MEKNGGKFFPGFFSLGGDSVLQRFDLGCDAFAGLSSYGGKRVEGRNDWLYSTYMLLSCVCLFACSCSTVRVVYKSIHKTRYRPHLLAASDTFLH